MLQGARGQALHVVTTGLNGYPEEGQASQDGVCPRRFRSASLSSSSSSSSYVPPASGDSWSPIPAQSPRASSSFDFSRLTIDDMHDQARYAGVDPPDKSRSRVNQSGVRAPFTGHFAVKRSNGHLLANHPVQSRFFILIQCLRTFLTLMLCYVCFSAVYQFLFKSPPINATTWFYDSLDIVQQWVEDGTRVRILDLPPRNIHELLDHLDRETLKPMMEARPSVELYCNMPPTDKSFPVRWEKTVEPLRNAVPSLKNHWDDVLYSDHGMFSRTNRFLTRLNEKYSTCEYDIYPVISTPGTDGEWKKTNWHEELYQAFDSMLGTDMEEVTTRLTGSVSRLKDNLGTFLTSLPRLEIIQEEALRRLWTPKLPVATKDTGCTNTVTSGDCGGSYNNGGKGQKSSGGWCQAVGICKASRPSENGPERRASKVRDLENRGHFEESLKNDTFFKSTLHNETFMAALKEAHAWARKVDVRMTLLRPGWFSYPARTATLSDGVRFLHSTLRSDSPDRVGMRVKVSWGTWLLRELGIYDGSESDQMDRDEAGTWRTYCPRKYVTCLPHPDRARRKLAVLSQLLYTREQVWNRKRRFPSRHY